MVGVGMGFIHLQVRSAYSLLNSCIKIKELVNLAKSRQMDYLALVEEGTMHSAIKFYTACQTVGIKPIIGMTVKIQGDSFWDEWTLLARNQRGYQGLLKLASYMADQDEAVYLNQILPYAEDLVVMTSGECGVLVTAIEEGRFDSLGEYYEGYLKSFPHLYIGLLRVDQRTYELSLRLNEFANYVNCQVVALNDVRYLNKEDAQTLSLLRAVKENKSVNDIPIQDMQRYFKTELEMRTLYEDIPNAIEQTQAIAELCEVEIPLQQQLLPKYPTDEGVTSDAYLEALCYKGLLKRYGHQEYAGRLTYELSVISKMGFSDYFCATRS